MIWLDIALFLCQVGLDHADDTVAVFCVLGFVYFGDRVG
jgi:hypothetical protein